jgi:hypothetical protein
MDLVQQSLHGRVQHEGLHAQHSHSHDTHVIVTAAVAGRGQTMMARSVGRGYVKPCRGELKQTCAAVRAGDALCVC